MNRFGRRLLAALARRSPYDVTIRLSPAQAKATGLALGHYASRSAMADLARDGVDFAAFSAALGIVLTALEDHNETWSDR